MRALALIFALTTLPSLPVMASTQTSGHAPAAPKARYVCPMHPEEVSDHAAKCSKCGMSLKIAEENTNC